MNFKVDRSNNFDFLRLVLASAVIISHSYPLTAHKEFLVILTHGQIDFGFLSVNGFFTLSGYFIFLSLQRSKTATNYFWKRILRLYPALFVLMAFTLFIAFIVNTGAHNWDIVKNFRKYASGCLSLYRVRFDIAGVFENNPYKAAVNGSLWTLSYEFSMYMLLLVLFYVRKKKVVYLFLFGSFFLSYYLYLSHSTLFQSKLHLIYIDAAKLYRLGTFFLAGSCLTFFDFRKINTLFVRIIISGLLIISLFLNFFSEVAPFLFSLLIILIGILNTKYINNLGEKLGDISYGVYIYGFLVQQFLMNYYHFKPVVLMILALCLTYFLAYSSWHLIEKKMLKYKDFVK